MKSLSVYGSIHVGSGSDRLTSGDSFESLGVMEQIKMSEGTGLCLARNKHTFQASKRMGTSL